MRSKKIIKKFLKFLVFAMVVLNVFAGIPVDQIIGAWNESKIVDKLYVALNESGVVDNGRPRFGKTVREAHAGTESVSAIEYFYAARPNTTTALTGAINIPWVAPTDTASVTVGAWAGGGGGGGSRGGTGVGGGGGGGGGAYAQGNVNVVAGNTYTAIIGRGGNGGAANANGAAGDNSTFNATSVVAAGGAFGGRGASGAAGAGGTLAASTGTTAEYAGGNGSAGVAGSNYSGAGGGGAGSGGGGTNASGTTAGTGGSGGGGTGGVGRSTLGAGNYAQSALGAGGGGGFDDAAGANQTGGAGQGGAMQLSYSYTADNTYPIIKGISGSRSSNANTNSHAITMPPGIVAGELLIVIFSSDGNAAASDGSGLWTKLGQVSGTTNVVSGTIFYKTAAGGDTLTVTCNTEQSSHIVYRIANAGGVPTGTSAVSSAAGTNSDPVTHSPAAGANNYLWIATRSGDSTVVATAAPGGYSFWRRVAAGGTSGASTDAAVKFAAAASENPGVWTSASEDWATWTLSVPPVPTAPAAPTNVAATDGSATDKVTVTWTKSAGATGYKVYEGSNLLNTLGDVATYDDTAAPAGTITPGTASATDGSSTAHSALSLSGQSANIGASRTYKVVAFNGTGDSTDSSTDTGYRGVGSLTYQWQRSAADSDASYSDIGGATTAAYNDTGAPAPTITPGTASATDGSATDKVTLTISGASASAGAGRYYKAVLNATGATQQTSSADRGYRGVGSLTYQWRRSAADSDASYSDIGGATTAPYDDTAAPAPTITPGTASATDGSSTAQVDLSVSGESANAGAGRYFYATISASGASSADTTHDRGYIGVGSLTYQWQVSAADSDASYSNIGSATTDPYSYSSAPAPTVTPGTASATDGSATDKVTLSISGASANAGAGRYYKVILNATGASQQASTADRGYRGVGSLTYQWRRSAADSDASYSDIGGATTAPYDDTAAPAPTITVGTVTATDGTANDYVTLSLSGESANAGAGRYYYATLNATGASSADTTHDRGNIGVGSLTYQWQRSAADSDASYSSIGGGTTDPYNDTGAPAGTVTPGTASATDGSATDKVTLSISGASASAGAGRYYKAVLNATGATQQTSSADRGYRGVGSLTYQWRRSAADSDASYSDIGGATTAPYDDTAAPAPTITPGTASATDGSSTAQVDLSVSGESANAGAGRYFYATISASGASSADTTHDRGYIGVGSLTYQWQVSAADSDASYSNIGSATTDPYSYSSAPAPTVTPGTASATDGSATDKVTLSISGASANAGAGRYYKVILNATGASQQASTADRGYRGVGSLTYQWRRSAADSDASYSDIGGATTAPYDDTAAPAPTITVGTVTATDGTANDYVTLSLSGESANAGAGRYYYATLNATGASSADTTHDRGNIGVGSLTYQWQRSAADSDASYSSIGGGTTDPYNDTGAPAGTVTPGTASATDGSATDKVTLSISGASASAGAGRYYKAVLNATGATQQTSSADRGYRGVGSLTYQWRRSAADSDASYSDIGGATTAPYDDTAAPAPTITVGTVTASDGTSVDYVTLSISGESTSEGAGRYFYATVSASGASSADTTHDRGNIGVGSLTYQWQRSAADSDASYSNIGSATTDPYDDTAAPSNGDGRYFKVILSATGAVQQTSAADRGFRIVAGISISGTAYASLSGAVLTDKSVKLYKNGSESLGSTSTNGSGVWTISAQGLSSGDILTVFIDTDAVNANTIYVSDGTAKSDIHLYGATLVFRSDTASVVTNADLAAGRVGAAPAGDMIFMVESNNLTASSGVQVVAGGGVYAPGGTVTTVGSGADFVVSPGVIAYLDFATNSIDGNISLRDNTGAGGALYLNADTTVAGSILASSTSNVLYRTAGADAVTPTLTLSGSGIISDGAGANATSSFSHMITSGSGTYIWASTTPVAGNLTIGSNTILDANTNDPTVSVAGNFIINSEGMYRASSAATTTIAGNFTNSGAFAHNNGTVHLTGANPILSGKAYFYNFFATTSDQTVTFAANAGSPPPSYGFAGTFTVQGTSGHQINLYSSVAGTQWDANIIGTSAVHFANLRDCGCGGGSSEVIVNDGTSTNSGNNAKCWRFWVTDPSPARNVIGVQNNDSGGGNPVGGGTPSGGADDNSGSGGGNPVGGGDEDGGGAQVLRTKSFLYI